MLAIAATALLITSITPKESEFKLWQTANGKVYRSKAEEHYREAIYIRNAKSIAEHNRNPHKNYEQGINQFTDLTQEEFVQYYLTTKVGS